MKSGLIMREIPFELWEWEEELRVLEVEHIALCKIPLIIQNYEIMNIYSNIYSIDYNWSRIDYILGCLHH